jgi:hypothetical protein
LASLTGGILGAIHGTHWLGSIAAVQDADYISGTATILATSAIDASLHHGRPSLGQFSDGLEALLASGVFVDGRVYRLNGCKVLPGDPKVDRFVLDITDGQSVLVDRIRASAPGTSTTANSGIENLPEEGPAEDFKAVGAKSSEVLLTLPTSDIEAVAAFYAELLNRAVPILDGTAHISPSVAFTRSAQPPPWSAGVMIQVSVLVEKPSAAAPASTDGGTKHEIVQLVDPDGRTVHLTRSSN